MQKYISKFICLSSFQCQNFYGGVLNGCILDIIYNNFRNQMIGNSFGLLFPTYDWYTGNNQYILLNNTTNASPQIQEDLKENFEENLLKKIKHLEQKIIQLQEQNTSLKNQLRPKRRYAKRKTHFSKYFQCQIEECGKIYSSNVALRCHMRKKHGECE